MKCTTFTLHWPLYLSHLYCTFCFIFPSISLFFLSLHRPRELKHTMWQLCLQSYKWLTGALYMQPLGIVKRTHGSEKEKRGLEDSGWKPWHWIHNVKRVQCWHWHFFRERAKRLDAFQQFTFPYLSFTLNIHDDKISNKTI